MINLKPGNEIVSIQLNVLLAIVAGISCLILFTYFIHTISQGIQVEIILEEIFQKTKRQLKAIDTAKEEQEIADKIPTGYAELRASNEGYYNGFNKEGLLELCTKQSYNLIIIVRQGNYVYPNMPIAYVSGKITSDDQTALLKHFFLENTIADDHYVYGLKYITEIGVKALSPGINDPGTALKAINFLTVIIQQRMSISERNSLVDSDNNVRILFKPLDLRTLVYHFYTPFRTYGRKDITVMLTMFRAFDTLIRADISERKYVSIFYDGMSAHRSTTWRGRCSGLRARWAAPSAPLDTAPTTWTGARMPAS
jgi:uncharacterized membrane protein